jgi:hypothetical protein
MQGAADDARVAAGRAAEAFFSAQSALVAATEKAEKLAQRVAAALDQAQTSRMRAGLLASHLAKTGSSVSRLMVDQKESCPGGDLLYQLGAVSNLTEQTQRVCAQAITDENTARALAAQAHSAQAERQNLTEAAGRALQVAKTAQALA